MTGNPRPLLLTRPQVRHPMTFVFSTVVIAGGPYLLFRRKDWL